MNHLHSRVSSYRNPPWEYSREAGFGRGGHNAKHEMANGVVSFFFFFFSLFSFFFSFSLRGGSEPITFFPLLFVRYGRLSLPLSLYWTCLSPLVTSSPFFYRGTNGWCRWCRKGKEIMTRKGGGWNGMNLSLSSALFGLVG